MGKEGRFERSAIAPGKVILTGEHFVVNGGLALACTVDRYIRVRARPADVFSVRYGFSGMKPMTKLARDHIYASIKDLLDGKGASLYVESNIPIGAGLGSSASSSVAAVLAISGLLNKPLTRQEVFEHAMKGERLVHSNPSGIDVMVSIMGGFMLYRKGEEPRPLNTAPLRALVVDTGQRHRTGDMVKGVETFAFKNRELFDGMVSMANSISSSAAQALIEGDLGRLGSLLAFNQELLNAIGVSTDKIELAIRSFRGVSSGSKLTGGGGGGFVINILKGDVIGVNTGRWRGSFIANLGVGGAKIEEPAPIRDGGLPS